jgi:CHAT domain-containing protein
MTYRALGLLLWMSWNLAFAADASLAERLRQGEALRQQGQYQQAERELSLALAAARTSEEEARAAGSLGETYARMRRYTQAEPLLRRALRLVEGQPQEQAKLGNALGNLLADTGRSEDALAQYRLALERAAGHPGLSLGIRLNQAALLPNEQRLAALAELANGLEAQADSPETARYWLNLGEQARTLGKPALSLAYRALEHARQAADARPQPRMAAEALAGLGKLYEDEGRADEALALTQQGILAAQRGGEAHDLLLDLEWQQGRLFRAQGQSAAAADAYRRAVAHIESIRTDIPVEYQDGRSSFRATLEPVYLGLADLLLAQARRDPEHAQTLLRQARDTVELLKQSELEDFLGSRCAVASAKLPLETLAPRTAVLYPILLPDRLEILVGTGTRLEQFTQPVSAATFQRAARELAQSFRAADAVPANLATVQALSRKLHDWVVAPIRPWLEAQQVETLVIVPDGALRLVPFSSLYDGAHYLIERYAVATSPGLALFEPAPLGKTGLEALLAGMSQPGSVLDHLPPGFLATMVQAEAEARRRGIGAAPSTTSRALPQVQSAAAASAPLSRDAERLMRDPAFRQSLKQMLSLPGVDQEIASLKDRVSHKALLNESFTLDAFREELAAGPYSVAHIASHGVFGSSAADTFIMAYDQVIDLDTLEQMFQGARFRASPVQLLTLSACQTAEGDDRAPLGFSGIALKARVRSALGTLWPVSDEAASRIMAEFYQQLGQPGVGKAEALRRAQLSLLKETRLTHPFFWSPFILVGAWL